MRKTGSTRKNAHEGTGKKRVQVTPTGLAKLPPLDTPQGRKQAKRKSAGSRRFT
jgi:hypothetical protein